MFLLTLTESLGLNVVYPKIFTLTFYKNHILEDVFILGKKSVIKDRSYVSSFEAAEANGQGSDQMFLLV